MIKTDLLGVTRSGTRSLKKHGTLPTVTSGHSIVSAAAFALGNNLMRCLADVLFETLAKAQFVIDRNTFDVPHPTTMWRRGCGCATAAVNGL
jgi:hypothetical protein